MSSASLFLLLLITFVSAATALLPTTAQVPLGGPDGLLKSKTFLSPPITLRPGDVSNKWYMDIPFPRGHIALKSFNGELVDARGAPVPLHETYLHHWMLQPWHYPAAGNTGGVARELMNAGLCNDTLTTSLLGQYFGLGAETRRTATLVPRGYGIEVGDPPAGYEERWVLNVHAIDTRGAVDRVGCTECRCDLYNVTFDGVAGYAGGYECCDDQTRCRVEEGFRDAAPRDLFLRYTVVWIDWRDAVLAGVVPVRIYILDITDTALLEGRPGPDCRVEYTVEECSAEDRARNECVDVRVARQVIPRGGDIVFGVGHQHAGGTGSALHGEDGRLLCESNPIYGDGQEAGNEAGYVVGMSTCYPAPGAARVRDGEALTIVFNYTSERRRTGVMGHFYFLVADAQEDEQPQQQPAPNKHVPAWLSGRLPAWLSAYL